MDLFGLSLIIPMIQAVSDYENLYRILSVSVFLEPLRHFTQNEIIILFLSIFLSINILKGIVFVYLNLKTNQFARDINQQISKKLIDYYSLISYERMINKSSSTLIRNITQEVEGVSNAVLNFLNLIVDLFVMICIFLFIVYIEPVGVLIISAVLLVGLLIFRQLIEKKLIKWGFERQNYYLKKLTNINQIFHSFSELKILKKINYFSKNYIIYNNQYYNNIIKYSVTQIIPRFLVEGLAVIGVALALIYLIIFNDDQQQILYALAILGASALRILPSTNRVMNLYNSFKFSEASLKLVRTECEELEKLPILNKNNLKSLEFNNVISVKNISYKYPKNEKYVLNDISFEIFKGDIVGIKGKTGGGKSTLLKIILGLLRPNKGNLCVDNVDINTEKFTNEWFDKISYVPQEIYLLDDSIKNNVLFGITEDEINDEHYKMALKASNCNNFIQSLEQGEETYVGENGVKLSGGQKQRVGLARAIYLNRDVLVLDEATNSLDEKTEKEIIKNILNMKNKPTIIFVSHKSSNFNVCSKIINISEINKNN